jgi:hypothetical protein
MWVFTSAVLTVNAPLQAQRSAGVIVEEVGKNSAGEKAGIKTGDVLESWVRAAGTPANPSEAGGTIDSPFDLSEIEIEQAPRGSVTIRGTRQGQPLLTVLPPGDWKIIARPQLPESLLRLYLEGQRLRDKDPQTAARLWQEEAKKAIAATNPVAASWLWLKTGDVLSKNRVWDDAHAAYRDAIKALGPSGDFRGRRSCGKQTHAPLKRTISVRPMPHIVTSCGSGAPNRRMRLLSPRL